MRANSSHELEAQARAPHHKWLCRYVSLMKKGLEAGATLRDGAADLWRKGVALTWHVGGDAQHAGAGERSQLLLCAAAAL